ncbi:large ribosomal subunit protein bL21m [Gadus morhua]|uniref:Large ribosomal subunit protein bL21m n=1 Tax=Gadus morhua TaxID=8049 RepID=A0A8C4ZC64_GADMO|nr:39S ribosomal protein L21, mitochondrial [Gadus morhua]XP_056463526.1 39S ribosomal protein L21, mitochondrial isoform X1 [Gadus chalcogrammus]
MALTLKVCCAELLANIWRLRLEPRRISSFKQTGLLFPSFKSHRSSHSISGPSSLVPLTSLSSPPWPEVKSISSEEEQRQNTAVVQKVNSLITNEEYGRLFAVVHFASRQWKVTNEDLILIENHVAAGCGDRIRMEKVLMVGGENFTLIGRPIIGKELVRVEATVIEKTESSPKVYMQFWRRHRFQRKKIITSPQTILRINSIEMVPRLK